MCSMSVVEDESLSDKVRKLEGKVDKLIEEKIALGLSIQNLIDNTHQLLEDKMNLVREVNLLKVEKNGVYEERNIILAVLCRHLYEQGYRVERWVHEGVDWEDDWRNIVVVYLEDDIQCSWHIHDSELYLFHWVELRKNNWNGHTTREKYRDLISHVMKMEVIPT